jgi:hypothetical protein
MASAFRFIQTTDYSDLSDGIRIHSLSNNKNDVEQHEQLSTCGIRIPFLTTD